MDKDEAINIIKNNLDNKLEALVYLADKYKDTVAMISLGNYYSKSDINKAISYFKQAGDYKNSNGFLYLGYIYLYGKYIEKDYSKAFKYLTKSYLLGNLKAALKLADLYIEGIYVNKDYSYAINYLEPIYNQGLKDLFNNKIKDNLLFEVLIRYYKFYLEGIGFKKSITSSLKCLILAKYGFEYQLSFNLKVYDKLKFVYNKIEYIKENFDIDNITYLDQAFDNHFVFSYVLNNDNIDFNFKFDDNVFLFDFNNLSVNISNNLVLTFNKVSKFNKIDYDLLRPIDYKLTGTSIKLYDEESTLMNFNFESVSNNLKHKYSYYEIITDLLKYKKIFIKTNEEIINLKLDNNMILYKDKEYNGIDDFIMNSDLRNIIYLIENINK